MNSTELQNRITNGESFLVANDGQYLGKLSLNKYASESIMNQYGNYGSKYSSTSIFNKYGNYGSAYSSLSPFNAYTSTPPSIYFHGRKIAYLTRNKYLGIDRIDPDMLFDWIANNNLRY